MQAQLAAMIGGVRQQRSPNMTLQLGPEFFVPHTHLTGHEDIWVDGELCGSHALAVSIQALPPKCEEHTWSLQLADLLKLAVEMRSAVPVARKETGGHWLAFVCDPNETLDYASMRAHLILLHVAGCIDFQTYVDCTLTVTRLQFVRPEKPAQPLRTSCSEQLAAPGIPTLSPRQRVTVQTVLDRWYARGLSDLAVGHDGLNIVLRAAGCNQCPALTTMRVVLADPFGSGRAVSALTAARVLLQKKEVRRVAVVCEDFATHVWREKIASVMPRKLHKNIDVVSSRCMVMGHAFDLCIVDVSNDTVWHDLALVRALNTMHHYIVIQHIATLDDVCGCVAFDDERARKLLREAMRSTQMQVNMLHCRLVVQTAVQGPLPVPSVVQVKLTSEEHRSYTQACMSLRDMPCLTPQMASDMRQHMVHTYNKRLDMLRTFLCGVDVTGKMDAINAAGKMDAIDAADIMDAMDATGIMDAMDETTAMSDAMLVPDKPCGFLQMHAADEMVVPSDPECIVCMDQLLCKTTLECGHSFCQPCIVEWLAEHASCPVCRHVPKEGLPAQHCALAHIVPLQPIATKMHALRVLLTESEVKTVVVARNAGHVSGHLDMNNIATRHVTQDMSGDQVYEAVCWFRASHAGVLVTDVNVHNAGIDVVAERVVLLDTDTQHNCAIARVYPKEWVRLVCENTVDTADVSTLREMMSVFYN